MKETLHVLMFCRGLNGHEFIFKCIIYGSTEEEHDTHHTVSCGGNTVSTKLTKQ